MVGKQKGVRVGADELAKLGRGHGVGAGVKLVFVEAAQRVQPAQPVEVVDEQLRILQAFAAQAQQQHARPLHRKVALGPQAKRILRGAQGHALVEFGPQLRVAADGFGAHGPLAAQQVAPVRKIQVVEAVPGVGRAVGVELRIDVFGQRGAGFQQGVEQKRAALLEEEAHAADAGGGVAHLHAGPQSEEGVGLLVEVEAGGYLEGRAEEVGVHILHIEQLRKGVGFAPLQPHLLAPALKVAQVDGNITGELHAGFGGVGVGQNAHDGIELVAGPLVEQQVHARPAQSKAYLGLGTQLHVGQLAQQLGGRIHALLAEGLARKKLQIFGKEALFGFGVAHDLQRVERDGAAPLQHHAPGNGVPIQPNGIEPDGGKREALVFGLGEDALLQLHPVGGHEGRAPKKLFAVARPCQQAVAEIAVAQIGPPKGLAHVQAHPHRVAGPAQLVGRGREVGVGLQAQHQFADGPQDA